MAADSTDKARRRGRRWLYVRLIAWALFLIWFGWFAYVRWTTPPAAQTRGALSADDRAGETVAKLAAALGALPRYNPAGSARGWWDGLDALQQALAGEWDPAGRPKLADVVKYVTTPNVSQTLDKISELCRELAETDATPHELAAVFGTAWGSVQSADFVIAALTVRARLRHAGQGNLSGALADLQAATFMRTWPSGLWLRHSYGAATAAIAELAYLAQEVDLPRAVAADALRQLSAERPLSPGRTLRAARVAGQAQAVLDRHYTDDGQGNGWLVLSSMESTFLSGPSTVPRTRSRFWNLFSPLFNDRKTVAAKLSRLDETLRELDSLDYDSIVTRVTEHSDLRRGLGILDGPLADASTALAVETLTLLTTGVAQRRSAVVMLALSIYKHEHGTYPAELTELVPDYLAEVPRDLVTNAPFVYRRTAPDAYELRSTKEIPGEVRFGGQGTSDAYTVRRPAARE